MIVHFYSAGKSRYLRLASADDLKIWDGDSLEAAPAWATTPIDMTENPNVGGCYSCDLPAALPTGAYYALIYDGTAATASDSDVRVQVQKGYWDGNAWRDIDGKLLLAAKILTNVIKSDKETGVVTVMDDDGTTAILTLTPDEETEEGAVILTPAEV